MFFRMKGNTAMNLARIWIDGKIVFKIPNRPFGVEPFTLEDLCTGKRKNRLRKGT